MDASFAESAKVTVGNSVDFLTKTRRADSIGQGRRTVKPNDASAGIQSGLIVAQLLTVQRWTESSGKLDTSPDRARQRRENRTSYRGRQSHPA